MGEIDITKVCPTLPKGLFDVYVWNQIHDQNYILKHLIIPTHKDVFPRSLNSFETQTLISIALTKLNKHTNVKHQTHNHQNINRIYLWKIRLKIIIFSKCFCIFQNFCNEFMLIFIIVKIITSKYILDMCSYVLSLLHRCSAPKSTFTILIQIYDNFIIFMYNFDACFERRAYVQIFVSFVLMGTN